MLDARPWSCFVVLLAASPLASAAPAADRVALDWAEVPDQVIRRCRLTGLQNVVMQQVVESGRAVVDIAREPDVVVHVRVDDAEILIEALTAGAPVQRTVAIPDPCGSWLQLDVAHAVVAVLDSIQGRRTEHVVVTEETPASLPPLAPSLRRWRLGAGVSTAAEGVWPQVAAEYDLARPAWLTAVAEVSALPRQGLFVVEPAVALRLAPRFQIGGLSAAAGIEAAVLGHFWTFSADDSGARVYARFGAPLLLASAAGRVSFLLVPWVRPRGVRHVVDGDEVFDAGRFGVGVRLMVGL